MTLLAISLLLMLLAGLSMLMPGLRPTVRDALFRICIVAGCVVGAVPALSALAGSPAVGVLMPGPARVLGGPWAFGIDALSAVFLVAIFGVGAAAAVYGVTYAARERDHRAVHRSVNGAHVFMTVLLAALVGVVTARAVVPFLIAWEIMAIMSYLLIMFEDDRLAVRRAGLLYIITTHLSTLTLFALFAVWGLGARDLTFAALAEHAHTRPVGSSVLLTLALIAFGIKAGIVPLHVWLPEAHAAAPSHISALMSGLVIKMGIYGLLRVVVLVASPAPWWGWVVLCLGAASGILGVVWALAQHDIKRLLAFHSVENIGIILLGVGTGALGIAYSHPVVAVLGFAGAAFHTLNHAVFKSLLFLGAGSVIHATGTRDLERLGGIAKQMPWTAATFLVGSAAIIGLPPLNGFLSEWLVYRALLRTGLATDGTRVAIVAAAALALIGALALACFAKVVGMLYLGTPRDEHRIGAAHESPVGMTGPLVTLALACVAIGVLPVLILPAMLHVGAFVAGIDAIDAHDVGASADPATWAVTVFTVTLGSGMALLWMARARWLRRPAMIADTWGCGFPAPSARMQYSASSFAAPLLAAFSPVAGVQVHRSATAFATHPIDPVLDRVVLPAWRSLRTAAGYVRPIQQGRVGLHLLYVGAALVTLLVYLIVAGGTV